jgi:peptidyl-prolyl cis-trans isomerase SurA
MRNKSRGRTGSAAGMMLCAFFSLAAMGHAELVDRVVAAVNNEVITLSELRQSVAFNAALGGKGSGRRLEAETLQGIINRRLLLQEAYRLKIGEVSEPEIAAEVGRLRQQLGTETAFREFLARTDLTEAQLAKLLGERLLVARFVEKKIGLFSRVNRDEAQAYFNQRPGEFKDKRFAEAQKQVMAYLSEQKVSQQLDQYVEELRSRTFIRINDVREEGE